MKKHSLLLLLLFISFLPLFGLLHSGIPITHDGKDHVARIANFIIALQDGVLIPRWAANLNWGYGHPILMFLYPLPSYIASFFYFLGFSFIDSTKLVFGTMYIVSGLTMYSWLKEFLRKESAFFGSVLYIFAPYRFVDLYVRGAIGEHTAFVFPPLICWCLYKLIKKKNYYYSVVGGLALAGLILAHNAISLMFIPFIMAYALFLLYTENDKRKSILYLVYSFILGFLLSAFFWLPAFFEGKYTLRDVVALHDYTKRLYPLSMFIYSKWSFGQTGEFSLQIGLIQWMVILSGLVLLVRRKFTKNLKHLTFLLYGYFFVTLIIMLPISGMLWDNISLIQKFQFPWRFLSVSVFSTAVLGGIVVQTFTEKNRTGILVMSLIAISLTFPFWKTNGYLNKPNLFFSSVYAGTTDTGESAPIWSVRFMEHTPNASVEVIQGKAIVENGIRTSTVHSYHVTHATGAVLRENTLYFPGWQVLVDGKKTPIQFQDPNNRGVISFNVPNGKHEVMVIFSETKLRTLSNIISLFGLLLVIISSILIKTNLWKRYQ